jgi:hypothetical protein
MIKKWICMTGLLFLVCFAMKCWGYEKIEHAAMNDWILEHSVGGFDFDQYVRQNLGIDGGMNGNILRYTHFLGWLTIMEYRSSRELVALGGMEEDEPFWRCKHHFHDPSQLWAQAGYHTAAISGESSILWAQMGVGEQSGWNGGNYSWYDARDYFYKALIGIDSDQRDRDLHNTFLAVGHLMHLIQDSSCPEHVRNDSHALDKSVYEKLLTYYNDEKKLDEYLKFQDWLISSQDHAYPFLLPALDLDTLPVNARVPIARMVDTDWYTGDNPEITINPLIGLAEYTNANFLSQGRIFEGYNYPNNDSSVTKELYAVTDPRDSNSTIEREYLTKTGDGDTGYRLCTTSITGAYQADLADPVKIYRVSALDDNVLEDYAGQLVPRAVSYSAELLEHFFRGTIEVSLPEDGVYAFMDTEPADPRTQGFNRVQLLVRNTTGTGERMLGGDIDLVIQYRFLTDRADPADPVACARDSLASETYADLSHFYYSEPLFIVKRYPMGADAEIIKPGNATLLTFDLGDDEIPLWAVDVRFFVVYKGMLGNEGGYVEEDAVCVGYKDATEPTPLVFANTTDIFCYNERWWYDLDNDDNLQALKSTYDSDDCIQTMTVNNVRNLEIKFSPRGMVPAAVPYYTVSTIEPGRYIRMYLITDREATLYYASPSYEQTNHSLDNFGLRNGVVNENGTLIWRCPVLTRYRAIEKWLLGNYVHYCPSCINGDNCTDCDDDAIDEDENLIPVGGSQAP